MVKKVKKYVKSVLCVVLMLSLVMPMHAANEASDPSAFITKEEFDKALADFNSRLSAFEAGINNKIDSQVTSYLDRNGIWSGKEQAPFKSDVRSMWNMNEDICVYVNQVLKNHVNDEKIFINSLLVKPNKNGLAYLSIKWNVNWAMGWYACATSHKLAEGSFNDISRIEDKTGTTITSIKLWNIYWSSTRDFRPMIEVGGNKNTRTVLFFVDRDIEYYLKAGVKFDGRIRADGTWNGITVANDFATTYNDVGGSTTSKTDLLWFDGTIVVY